MSGSVDSLLSDCIGHRHRHRHRHRRPSSLRLTKDRKIELLCSTLLAGSGTLRFQVPLILMLLTLSLSLLTVACGARPHIHEVVQSYA